MDYKIKYIDLLYSVYSSLKQEFDKAKIAIKENRTEVKQPLFFIQINALESDSFRSYTKELVNITITYTQPVLEQQDILNIKDSLNELFDDGLRVEKTFIYFDKKKFYDGDGFVNLTLTLRYHNSKLSKNLPDSDRYTQMLEELHLKINE